MTQDTLLAESPGKEAWLIRDPDLERGPISGFVFNTLELRQVPPHSHERAQLIHIMSGVAVITIDQNSWTLPPRRAILIPADTIHAVRYPRESEMRTLFFDALRIDEDVPQEVRIYHLDNLSHALLSEASQLEWGTEPNRIEQLTIELLFARLMPCSEASYQLPEGRDQRLRRVIQHLKAHPRDNATLDELAVIGACSRRTLFRLFNEETGMSPALWRRQMRMGLALELLAASVPIGRIAWELGYTTPGNFSVAFKSAFGAAPREYFTFANNANTVMNHRGATRP